MSPKRVKPTEVERASGMVGRIVDSRYRILDVIGQGGMGWVYRAEHLKIRRTVALKMLNPGYKEYEGIAERFEREAFATGRLDHPNCVAVFDCGTLEDKTVYLAMEFVEGVSLADELDENPDGLGVYRALHIARHLLDGLGHAHQAGVIHRDIKPDNVLLVDHEGDPDFVKILDFGIAKLTGRAATESGNKQLTQAGLTMGTPYYMSPEQAFGKALDGRSDIYAASVLLYEMLTGHLPFYDTDKLTVLTMHTNEDPPLFAEIVPHLEIPTEVELLVRHGLAKKCNERIGSAETYVNRIDRLLDEMNGVAKGPSGSPDASPGDIAQKAGNGEAAEAEKSSNAAIEVAFAAKNEPLQPGPSEPEARPEVRPEAIKVPPVAGEAAEAGDRLPQPAAIVALDAVQDRVASLASWMRRASARVRSPKISARDGRSDGREKPVRNGLAHWRGQWRALPVRLRWTLLASVAIALTLATLAQWDSNPTMLQSTSAVVQGSEKAASEPSKVAARAAEILEQYGPTQAMAFLTAAPMDPADGHAQLILGHAHAALDHPSDALVAYRTGIEIAPELAADPAIHNLLASVLDRKRQDHIDQAMAVLEVIVRKSGNREARDKVVAMASSHKYIYTRSRAFELAESLDIAGDIDRLASYTLDLEQGPKCQDRRSAVPKLRDLGDKKAIPVLRKALKRMRKRSWLDLEPHNTNDCLVEDARAAIAHLERLD